MKTNRLKKGICWLLPVLMVWLVLGETSFAFDVRDISKNSSFKIIKQEGNFGLARVRVRGSKGKTLKNVREAGKAAAPEDDTTPRLFTYAAFTSYDGIAGINKKNVYWPWVYKDKAFLFVAFRANSVVTMENINWEIWKLVDLTPTSDTWESLGTANWNFESETLNPDYWYFAWWNPTSDDLGGIPLANGLHSFEANPAAVGALTFKTVKCYFEVVPTP